MSMSNSWLVALMLAIIVWSDSALLAMVVLAMLLLVTHVRSPLRMSLSAEHLPDLVAGDR